MLVLTEIFDTKQTGLNCLSTPHPGALKSRIRGPRGYSCPGRNYEQISQD